MLWWVTCHFRERRVIQEAQACGRTPGEDGVSEKGGLQVKLATAGPEEELKTG